MGNGYCLTVRWESLGNRWKETLMHVVRLSFFADRSRGEEAASATWLALRGNAVELPPSSTARTKSGPQGRCFIMRMYIHHEVKDYAAWRKAYDAFDATRKILGVTAQAVYRSVDDPNDVTATHDFRSAEKAKAFRGITGIEDGDGEGRREGRAAGLDHGRRRQIDRKLSI